MAPATCTPYPGVSSVPGLAVPGYSIPSMCYSPQITNALSIRVYDDTMSRVGEIALYTSLNITHNWYTPHTWELIVNRHLPNVSMLEPKGYITSVADTAIQSDPFVGAIEMFQPVLTADGRASELWTLSGRSPKGSKFHKRRCMNKFSVVASDGYDVQTGVAYETAMRHTVNDNVVAAKGLDGAADTGRNISGITLATVDGLKGGTAAELKTRGDKLLDVLETWSRASALSCDLVWTGSGNNYVFEVNAGTDRSATVVLSVDYRNVLAYKYMYSIIDEANVMYMAGTGEGDARLIQEVYSSSRPTGEARNEEFLDASDCTTADQLTTRGNEQLITHAAVQTLSFEYDPTSTSYVLNRDFFLGDIIKVDFPGVATLTSRITSIKEMWSTSGYKVEITVGTDKPDMVSIVKKINAGTSAIRRK